MSTLAKERGFTLVELIVVIAIVAILAAVSIIGFTRYIENARMSNDNQAAAQMTDVVQYYLTGKPDMDLDATDVRSLIEENSGGSFDFTPQSRDHAFVYLADSKEVIVVDVEEAIGSGIPIRHSETTLLSDVTELDAEETIDTPEEIFGAGTFLISTGGSTVADFVTDVRQLAESDNLLTDFDALVTNKDGLSNEAGERDFIAGLLDNFDPDFNLFVNNNSWSHIPYEVNYYSNEFRRIVFQDGIKNLPTMTTASIAFIHIDANVSIPRTVKTIEYNALSKVYVKPGTVIDTTKLENAKAESGAFSSTQVTSYNIFVSQVDTFDELDVVASWYNTGTSEWVDFVEGVQSLTVDTRVQFDITNIPRHLIDDIIIMRVTRQTGTFYYIKAYNDESGLIGTTMIQVEYTE
jgi:prepilin-type N-terminal cleavage/methylation domain-containing protein